VLKSCPDLLLWRWERWGFKGFNTGICIGTSPVGLEELVYGLCEMNK